MGMYELTIVLTGATTPAGKKATSEKIEKLVKNLKGKFMKSEDWGKIDLAYPIAKADTGIFLYSELELDSQAAKAINEKLRLENDIIRYLLVRKDK